MSEVLLPRTKPTTDLSFEAALRAMKDGRKVRRSIWGGYWYLAANVVLDHDPIKIGGSATEPTGMLIGGGMSQLIIAVLKDGQGLAPASPYQQDLLADDWQIVE